MKKMEKSNVQTYVCLFHLGWILQFWTSKEFVPNTPTKCTWLRCIKCMVTVVFEISGNSIDCPIQSMYLTMWCIRDINTKNRIFPHGLRITRIQGSFQAVEFLCVIAESHIIVKKLLSPTMSSNTVFVAQDWIFQGWEKKIDLKYVG